MQASSKEAKKLSKHWDGHRKRLPVQNERKSCMQNESIKTIYSSASAVAVAEAEGTAVLRKSKKQGISVTHCEIFRSQWGQTSLAQDFSRSNVETLFVDFDNSFSEVQELNDHKKHILRVNIVVIISEGLSCSRSC